MRVDQMIFLAGLLGALAGYLYFKRARKKRPYGQTFDDVSPPKPTPKSNATDDAVPEKLTLKKRLGGIAFLTFWIILWTSGIYVAGHTWLSMSPGEAGYIILMIWLVFAIPAWFFVARTIFKLVRGDNVEMSFDGEAN